MKSTSKIKFLNVFLKLFIILMYCYNKSFLFILILYDYLVNCLKN